MTRTVNNYGSVHKRLRRVRGKASDYECNECGKPAQEWAFRHDRHVPSGKNEKGFRFSGDIDHYDPLCKPCHNLLDIGEIIACPNGHEYLPDNMLDGRRKCKECEYQRNNERYHQRRKS